MTRQPIALFTAMFLLLPFVASCQEKAGGDKTGEPAPKKGAEPKKELTREQTMKSIEKDFVQARQQAFQAMRAAKTPEEEKNAQKLLPQEKDFLPRLQAVLAAAPAFPSRLNTAALFNPEDVTKAELLAQVKVRKKEKEWSHLFCIIFSSIFLLVAVK